MNLVLDLLTDGFLRWAQAQLRGLDTALVQADCMTAVE